MDASRFSDCQVCGMHLRDALFCAICGFAACSWRCLNAHAIQHLAKRKEKADPELSVSKSGVDDKDREPETGPA